PNSVTPIQNGYPGKGDAAAKPFRHGSAYRPSVSGAANQDFVSEGDQDSFNRDDWIRSFASHRVPAARGDAG
ncbi:MAG: hypothetical protein AAFV72_24790, partial [Cyanobacteria bacterium J06635_1]